MNTHKHYENCIDPGQWVKWNRKTAINQDNYHSQIGH